MNVAQESNQKLRGGYYTPLELTVFLTHWIKEIDPKHILEPSCGDGVFFARAMFAAINKVSGDTLEIKWDVSYS